MVTMSAYLPKAKAVDWLCDIELGIVKLCINTAQTEDLVIL
jgi:hypothetical protein